MNLESLSLIPKNLFDNKQFALSISAQICNLSITLSNFYSVSQRKLNCDLRIPKAKNRSGLWSVDPPAFLLASIISTSAITGSFVSTAAAEALEAAKIEA